MTLEDKYWCCFLYHSYPDCCYIRPFPYNLQVHEVCENKWKWNFTITKQIELDESKLYSLGWVIAGLKWVMTWWVCFIDITTGRIRRRTHWWMSWWTRSCRELLRKRSCGNSFRWWHAWVFVVINMVVVIIVVNYSIMIWKRMGIGVAAVRIGSISWHLIVTWIRNERKTRKLVAENFAP